MSIRAKIVSADDCNYPFCERCKHYKNLENKKFCDIPVVLTKQDILMLNARLDGLDDAINMINGIFI